MFSRYCIIVQLQGQKKKRLAKESRKNSLTAQATISKRPSAQLSQPFACDSLSLLLCYHHTAVSALKVQDMITINLDSKDPSYPISGQPRSSSSKAERRRSRRNDQSRPSVPGPKKLLSEEKGSKKLLDWEFSLTEPSRDDLTDSSSPRSCLTSCFNFACLLSRSV